MMIDKRTRRDASARFPGAPVSAAPAGAGRLQFVPPPVEGGPGRARDGHRRRVGRHLVEPLERAHRPVARHRQARGRRRFGGAVPCDVLEAVLDGIHGHAERVRRRGSRPLGADRFARCRPLAVLELRGVPVSGRGNCAGVPLQLHRSNGPWCIRSQAAGMTLGGTRVFAVIPPREQRGGTVRLDADLAGRMPSRGARR